MQHFDNPLQTVVAKPHFANAVADENGIVSGGGVSSLQEGNNSGKRKANNGTQREAKRANRLTLEK